MHLSSSLYSPLFPFCYLCSFLPLSISLSPSPLFLLLSLSLLLSLLFSLYSFSSPFPFSLFLLLLSPFSYLLPLYRPSSLAFPSSLSLLPLTLLCKWLAFFSEIKDARVLGKEDWKIRPETMKSFSFYFNKENESSRLPLKKTTLNHFFLGGGYKEEEKKKKAHNY